MLARRACFRYIIGTWLVTVGFPVGRAPATEPVIDLAGQWQVQLESDCGPQPMEQPPAANGGSQTVELPGALRDSGLGEPVGPDTHWIGGVRTSGWNQPRYAPYRRADHFKVPFWLQPERHYVGPAWYSRSVEIPESWRGQRVILSLERPHWRTRVWVDGHAAGEGDSLATPHRFEISQWLDPGLHKITICVDNSLEPIDVGLNSHSVSDHTQTAWNGIVGRIELRAEPRVAALNVQVYPAADGKSARIRVQLANATGQKHQDVLKLKVLQNNQVLGEKAWSIGIPAGGTWFDDTLPFDRQGQCWDEFQPSLCQLEAALQSDHADAATRQVTFGIRHIATRGRQFVLNGRPIFLRGTLECCIFPKTGYPPTDVSAWKRIISICKTHGLNHIRFHSWCPPAAAFIAADELGFYFQVECSTWPNQSTALGEGRPIDAWLYQEAERILATYGNHPSFLLLAAGNEPAGPGRGGQYLGPWIKHFQAKEDRRLVTGGSGWPSIAENAYHVTPTPRIQQWGQGVKSRINARPPETRTDYREIIEQYDVPVIGHEIGQWCVYPNFDEIGQYTGTLKPRNFEIFRDLLGSAKMPDQAHDFLMASGKLQALCYKEEIESALRTPAFGGFQLLDLHDFPGQGTALVGVLDPFWNSKPYIGPEEFRQFCNAVVPLARMAKRTWTTNETFHADIEVAHFGPRILPATVPRWAVVRGGEEVAAGTLAEQDLLPGGLRELGRIEVPLTRFVEPVQLTLSVTVDGAEQSFTNRWHFWVYPSQVDRPPSDDVLVVKEFNTGAVAHLRQGGEVLLLADPNTVKGDVVIGFSSIFWNTAWTQGQAPHTLGILCDPEHPALAAFPTDYHSDWQWWELISRAKPMDLDDLPAEFRPIVQVVPDWFDPQRLGLVLEAKIGGGKLLACSIDLEHDLPERPAARQMFCSLLRYMKSADFDPPRELTAAQVHSLFLGH